MAPVIFGGGIFEEIVQDDLHPYMSIQKLRHISGVCVKLTSSYSRPLLLNIVLVATK
jgi:hypothetical protein